MRRITALVSVFACALVLAPVAARGSQPPQPGPDYDVPAADLGAAVHCPDRFDHVDATHQPVLLVHGTFTNDDENWGMTYEPALTKDGFDVCTVTLPDRSLGDIQVQAEYVVYAIREIATEADSPVDVIGHSQGGLQPRWAVKWWTDVRAHVDDLVMLAVPNHGAETAVLQSPFGCFESCYQMTPGSNFLTALNAERNGGETPGTISYTSIYSLTDELVGPAIGDHPSAALNASGPQARLQNILIQDVCPGRPVEHGQFAFDGAVYQLVLDALTHEGPADPARAGSAICLETGIRNSDPTQALTAFQRDMQRGFPAFHYTTSEPPLKDYAQ